MGDEVGFELRPLDAHRVMLVQAYRIDPPVSGEGQNGACDTTHFAVWILDTRTPSLRQALKLDGYGPDLCAGSGLISAELSADGRSVTSVRRSSDPNELPESDQQSNFDFVEVRERYCLDEASDTYLRCWHRVRAVRE